MYLSLNHPILQKLMTNDFTETNEYTLCFTKEKRKEINHIIMKALYDKNRRRTGLKLGGLQ
jgi:hypothetical protein